MAKKWIIIATQLLQIIPPPLPSPSEKRILPAFLLGLIFCAHRIYAGKYLTGFLQIGWIASSFVWFEQSTRDLLNIIHTGTIDLATLERISDWQQTHPIPILPMLSLTVVGIWVALDLSLLMVGKFKDRHGKNINRWI